MMISLTKEECVYTSCYCEENVWKLCDHVRQHHRDELKHCYAVFISNAAKMIPIWYQQARRGPGDAVVWDYHVICLHCPEVGDPQVYDLDTLLPFPCGAAEYIENSMKSDTLLKAKYHRKFRVIPAELFLETFASDRSHMKTGDGQWINPPPPYPCIEAQESTMNLDDFMSMEQTVGVGQVVDLTTFTKQFT